MVNVHFAHELHGTRVCAATISNSIGLLAYAAIVRSRPDVLDA